MSQEVQGVRNFFHGEKFLTPCTSQRDFRLVEAEITLAFYLRPVPLSAPQADWVAGIGGLVAFWDLGCGKSGKAVDVCTSQKGKRISQPLLSRIE